MALEARYFGQIRRKGDKFFMDDEERDSLPFDDCFLRFDMRHYFDDHAGVAAEKAGLAFQKEDDGREVEFSLGQLLSFCEDFRKQAEDVMNDRNGAELSLFINTFMNRLGRNALDALLSDSDSSWTVSAFDGDDYLAYVDVNGKKLDVVTSRKDYSLMLLDGSSVDNLLVPDATVFVRIKPDVEYYLENAFGMCCRTFKEYVDSGLSDEEAFSRIENVISEKNQLVENYGRAIAEMRTRMSQYASVSNESNASARELKKLYVSRKYAASDCKVMSAMKEIIRIYSGLTVPEFPLKDEILRDILSCNQWKFDVPGFVSRDDVKFITTGLTYKIAKGQFLFDLELDRDTFYVRGQDLRPISDIREII